MGRNMSITDSESILSPQHQLYVARSMLLHGTVDATMHAGALSSLLSFQSQAPKGLVTVYISGPGGSVCEGLGILDSARSISCPIRTVVTGMAASMSATLAACMGDKGNRYIMPNAELMIHQPLGGTQGQESDLEINYQHSRRIRERLDRLLAEATDKPIEQIHRDTERDLWLSAEEAVAYGLVDHILQPQ